MRLAITCAMMAMTITATRASTPVVIIDQDLHVWPSAYPLQVAPHTAAYALVTFTGLEPGCAVQSGCRCFRWRGTAKAVRWPPLEPGEQQCINVSTRLVETSDSVVPLAALLPVAEIPILWPIVRERICTARDELGESLTELVVASSPRSETVCARARSDAREAGSVESASRVDTPSVFFGVFAFLVAGGSIVYILRG